MHAAILPRRVELQSNPRCFSRQCSTEQQTQRKAAGLVALIDTDRAFVTVSVDK